MKFALASCAKIQVRPSQPAWELIERHKPELLLLLGDNVYGGVASTSWKKFHKNLEKRYQLQLNEQHFKHLASKIPFKAIWDDHDFALGDNGKGAEIAKKYKNRSRQLFHHYMNCSTNLPETYYSFKQGNAKFIMLDVRYYREVASRAGTILGKKQEKWLEKELIHNKKYTIICSGSCLTKGDERWKSYKNYYTEFCQLAKNANNVIFLSGDIHKNNFIEHDGFIEVTSSGVAKKKKDNYGIVNLTDDHAIIQLRGNKDKDNITACVDARTWKVL